MWHHVAAQVAEWGAEVVGENGLSAVGAVVGATHPRAVGEARKLMPQAVLLLPGIGAQGGDAGRSRPRVHERPGERARQRLAVGHLRLARHRRATTARPPAPRPPASARRSGRCPAGSASRNARGGSYAAPVAFLLAATLVVVFLRTTLHRRRAAPRQAAGRADVVQAAPSRRAGAAQLYRVRAGDTLATISAATGIAGRAPRAAEPERRADLALHRRPHPPAVRRLLLAACLAGGRARRGRPRPPRRRPAVEAHAWLVQNGDDGRGARASSAAREHFADRVDHEADDGARRARPAEAHRRRHRRPARRRGRRRRASTCARGEQITVRELVAGGADPVAPTTPPTRSRSRSRPTSTRSRG